MKKAIEKTGVVWIVLGGAVVFMVVWILFCLSLKGDVDSARMNSDSVSVSNGVGRVVETVELPVCASYNDGNDSGAVIKVWCETDENLPEWFDPDSAEIVWISPEEASETVGVSNSSVPATSPNAAPVRDIGCPDAYWGEKLTDSRGATAERWEIEEAIRELMLEAGGESEADIREHAAIYCKRLLYTQTVGGYDDWGTTLHEVVYSHGFLETHPYIWHERANPTDKVREIWWDVWNNGYTSDFRVQNFRSGYYAHWSIPAYNIGNTYYGINPWQDFTMFEWGE